MKRSVKITAILLFTLLFVSCHKKYPRKGESGNRGEIIDNYNFPDCYGPKNLSSNNEYIIKSFDDLDTSRSYYNCVKGQPNIDFTVYSVIGKSVKGDCSMKIRRELKIDHQNKQYIYTINFKDRGMCKKLVWNDNFVIVPKIPNDYTVVFKVEEDGFLSH